MMHILKSWLCMAVEEEDERGQKHRTTRNRDQGKGTPQGAPISPLLSNLYMRRFVLGWQSLGYQQRLKAFVVNYADDLVICCRGSAAEALTAMREMMSRLKLTMNESKTRVCRIPQETFDFLGYTFGRLWSPRTGGAYLGVCPSKKRIQRLCEKVTAANRPTQYVPTGGGSGTRLKPDVVGMVELLQPRERQPGPPHRGQPRRT
jgi:RNA-directed DNA polymerase